MKPLLVAIVGPTASGKTSAAIKVASELKTEILSADSRQFFKEMNIGTAKPSKEELDAVPHHFIGHLSIEEDYDAGKYEEDILKFLDGFYHQKSVAVLVGGSGMYVDAVCNGFDALPDVPAEIREELNHQLRNSGIGKLRNLLAEKDPEYYKQVDLNNPQRIVRALEICISSGKPYSSFRKYTPTKRPFDIYKIGLDIGREELYHRINLRVDEMIRHGLVEEARLLYPKKHLNALQTVGYKELFNYFEGGIPLEKAIELIKQNTRNYAKRQLTWLRREKSIKWYSPTDYEGMLNDISKQRKKLNN